uniref:LRAT domain-containing protein n=1 Tax=Amphimedon queenslandica TaxID=400682 RepID=A0A1X7TIC3_AMPQE
METPDETSRLDYYGAFSHAIDVKDLKPGDHIYCHRSALFFYSHHGIYVGEPDCEVIHFSGIPDSLPKDSEKAKEIEKKLKISIKSTTLANFQNGSTLRLVAYSCSGTKNFFAVVSSHYVKAMPPSETVKLAKHFMIIRRNGMSITFNITTVKHLRHSAKQADWI